MRNAYAEPGLPAGTSRDTAGHFSPGPSFCGTLCRLARFDVGEIAHLARSPGSVVAALTISLITCLANIYYYFNDAERKKKKKKLWTILRRKLLLSMCKHFFSSFLWRKPNALSHLLLLLLGLAAAELAAEEEEE